MPATPTKAKIVVAQGGSGDVLCHGPLLDFLVAQSEGDLVVVLAAHPEMLAGRTDVVILSLKEQLDWRNDFRRLWHEVRTGGWQIAHWSGVFPYANWSGRGDKRRLVQIIAEAHGFYQVDPEAIPQYEPTSNEIKAANQWIRQFRSPVVIIHNPDTCQGAKKYEIGKAPSVTAEFVQIGSTDESRIPWARNALGMPIRDAASLLFSEHVRGAILGESVFAHIAASSPLGKRAIIPFTCMDPDVFGHPETTSVYNSGGCRNWPCNGPVGGFNSLAPGYLNLETGKPMSCWCDHRQRLCGPSWDVVFETAREVLNV